MGDEWIDIILFAVIGLSLAMLLKVFYDNGIIIDSYVSSTDTIGEYMALIVIVVIVVGVVLIGVKKR